MLFWRLFGILVALAGPAFAENARSEANQVLLDLLRPGENSPNYRHNDCAGNVCDFLRQAKLSALNKIDLTRARVLFVLPAGQYSIPMFYDEIEWWQFHVTLDHNDLIYDFAAQAPLATPSIVHFLTRHFLPTQGEPDRTTDWDYTDDDAKVAIKILVIPALDYVYEFGYPNPSGRSRDHHYYVSDPEARERYPLISLGDALGGKIPHVFPQPEYLPDAPLPTEPRIVVTSSTIGEPTVAKWRDGDTTALLRGELGEWAVLRRGEPIEDPERLRRFQAAVRARRDRDPLLLQVWKKYQSSRRKKHRVADQFCRFRKKARQTSKIWQRSIHEDAMEIKESPEIWPEIWELNLLRLEVVTEGETPELWEAIGDYHASETDRQKQVA